MGLGRKNFLIGLLLVLFLQTPDVYALSQAQ